MRTFLLFLFATLPAWAVGQANADQSFLDQNLVTFKARLHLAVVAQDTAMLRPLLADSVYLQYDDGPVTRDSLLELLATNPESHIWSELAHSSRFGFKRTSHWNFPDQTVYQGPAYNGSFDPFAHVLITGEGVRIRNKPGYNGRVLGVASFELLDCNCDLGEMTVTEAHGDWWLAVQYKGQTGYVRYDLTSAAYARFIQIEEQEGVWVLTWLYEPPGC